MSGLKSSLNKHFCLTIVRDVNGIRHGQILDVSFCTFLISVGASTIKSLRQILWRCRALIPSNLVIVDLWGPSREFHYKETSS